MHLISYLGLGAGLAVAAGLRPFPPALLAGLLGRSDALGVSFAHTDYSFLQSWAWLIAVTVAIVAGYVLAWRLGSERLDAGPIGSALAGVAIGIGALLFAGTLAAHHDVSWPGLIGGAACAGLCQAAVRPVLIRTRARLEDRAAREALALYLDATALLATAIVALLHPFGYVLVILAAWLLLASRRRAGEKYAGLRILRD